MTSNEKRLWSVVLFYAGLLALSAFVVSPNWRVGGVAWNLTFWILGPTLGTLLLSAGTLVLVAGRKISVRNGIAAIVFLAVISAVCLAFTFPAMMSV